MNHLRIPRIVVLLGLVLCMVGTVSGYPRRFDVSGDGRSDIVWVNSLTGEKLLWLMNGGQIIGGGVIHSDPNWQLTHYGDFNGDGKSDLMWRNSVTGDTGMWLMNGSAYTSGLKIASIPFVVVGVGDFDGVASSPLKDDLILEDQYWQWGLFEIWVMNGTTKVRSSAFNRGTNFSVTHVGRFRIDLNQEDDMIWYNQVTMGYEVWFMNAFALAPDTVFGTLRAPSVITHLGDFNGDGRDDLLWRRATGEVFMHFWPEPTEAETVVPANWTVVAVDDFNGDGKADLLLRNAATGETAVWLMDGWVLIAGAGLLGGEWQISGTGDFNGDGKADILFSNTVTHEKVMWLMGGIRPISGYLLSDDPNWSILQW